MSSHYMCSWDALGEVLMQYTNIMHAYQSKFAHDRYNIHLSKRNTRVGPSERKGKMVKFTDEIEEEEEVGSDDSTTNPSVGDGEDDDDGSHGHGVGEAITYGAGVVIHKEVVWRIGDSPEIVISPMPHKIQIMVHLIHGRRETNDVIRFAFLLMMEATLS